MFLALLVRMFWIFCAFGEFWPGSEIYFGCHGCLGYLEEARGTCLIASAYRCETGDDGRKCGVGVPCLRFALGDYR
jgi:hypothetical protein